MKKLIIFTLLAFCNAACFLKKDISPALGELLISGKGVVSGNVVTKNLSAGGEIAVNGMKLIATAGAVKGDVSLQALSNTMEDGMPAIRITAEILKPIEFEMPYNGSEQFPENLRIAFQLSSGLWMYSDNVKVDATKKVLKIKLSAKYNLKKARKGINEPKTVDLASARIFFIKPETAKVKIGESVSLEVYAREGYIRQNISKAMRDEFLDDDTDLSIDDFLKNKQLEKEIIIKNLEEAGEEVTPLHLITNDYKFSNKKTGYTRSWTVSGVGKVAETGNSGAKYTAPNEASAKGKRVKVTFESTNIKTGRKAIATGNVLIDDGITRYVGSITYTIKEYNKTSQTEGKSTATHFGKFEFEEKPNGQAYEANPLTMYGEINEYIHSSISRDYSTEGKLLSPSTSEGLKDKGRVYLSIFKDKNTYQINGSMYVKGTNNYFSKRISFGNVDQSITDYTLINTGIGFSTGNDQKINDIKLLKGENSWKNDIIGATYTAKWEFKLVE